MSCVCTSCFIALVDFPYYVIDVSNLKLSRLEADNFSVTWDKAYAPTEFTVEEYNITVVNQDGQILQRGSVDAAPGRLDYSYTYAEPNHPDHGPVCLRLVFSVVAVADGKSSQGESVSWSGPERSENLTGLDPGGPSTS